MLQIKFMLFAAVVLTAINSTVAIVGGEDAVRGQFPYFVYLESYIIRKIDLVLATTTVINAIFHTSNVILCKNVIVIKH